MNDIVSRGTLKIMDLEWFFCHYVIHVKFSGNRHFVKEY